VFPFAFAPKEPAALAGKDKGKGLDIPQILCRKQG
jgi:hypothetical protein